MRTIIEGIKIKCYSKGEVILTKNEPIDEIRVLLVGTISKYDEYIEKDENKNNPMLREKTIYKKISELTPEPEEDIDPVRKS